MTPSLTNPTARSAGYTLIPLPTLADPAALHTVDELRCALRAVQDELLTTNARLCEAQQSEKELSQAIAALAVAWHKGRTDRIGAWFDQLWDAAARQGRTQ